MLYVFVGKQGSGEELDWETLSTEELLSLAATPTLFDGARTFRLIGALGGERGEELLDLAWAFAQSPHTFYFEEEKLLKAPSVSLVKAGATVAVEKAPKKENGFDRFGATAALARRDKKALWLALIQAFRSGEKPEALAGLLTWKARQMKDIGLSRTLVMLYHDAHRGAGSLELLLERFALTL